MKKSKRNLMRYLIIPLLLLPLQGCLDIYLTTEILPNGQIVKTIVIEGDSTSILDSYLPAATNETWESEWIKVDDEKHKFVLTKTFKNDKEFNLDMNPQDSMAAVRVTADLKRKFRWFFTYLDYKENLLPSNPFTILNWKDYLSTDEVELIAMDEEERELDPRYNDDFYDQAEEKFEDYLFRSGFEEFYVLFIKAITETDGSMIKVSEVEEKKEDIYQFAQNETYFGELDDLIEAYEAILGADRVRTINTNNPDIIIYFNNKSDFFNECIDDNYYFTIKMPGLLVETNSNKIEGSNLSWDVDFFDFYFKGLIMQAQSRIVNIWAFIVAGGVILILLLSLIWNIFRQKNQ